MSTPESLTVDPSAEIDALRTFYDETGAYLDDLGDDALFDPVPDVSGWSVAQHLYHVWRANASMLKAARLLAAGRVETKTPKLSQAGRNALVGRSIPRGVAEAPDSVRPPDEVDRDSLRDTWRRSRDKLEDVASAADELDAAKGGLPHPMWGILTAPQWLRAAHVHSSHHADIVTDVLAHRA